MSGLGAPEEMGSSEETGRSEERDLIFIDGAPHIDPGKRVDVGSGLGLIEAEEEGG